MTNNSDKKSHFDHFEGNIEYFLPCEFFFFLKLYKALRTAQYKQPRLIKPLLNFDVNFIFKSSGTNLLETIVSY